MHKTKQETRIHTRNTHAHTNDTVNRKFYEVQATLNAYDQPLHIPVNQKFLDVNPKTNPNQTTYTVGPQAKSLLLLQAKPPDNVLDILPGGQTLVNFSRALLLSKDDAVHARYGAYFFENDISTGEVSFYLFSLSFSLSFLFPLSFPFLFCLSLTHTVFFSSLLAHFSLHIHSSLPLSLCLAMHTQ